MYPDQTSQASMAPPMPSRTLMNILEDTQKQIADVANLITLLEERLDNILEPSTMDSSVSDTCTPSCQAVAVANVLESQVTGLGNYINDITKRIQL